VGLIRPRRTERVEDDKSDALRLSCSRLLVFNSRRIESAKSVWTFRKSAYRLGKRLPQAL